MNDIIPTGNGPFDPSLKMSSIEIAELAEKNHRDVMRDIRNLIDQGAIDQRRSALISYLDQMNREQPMYELDFESSMTLITGYDAPRRAKVIKRWMALERGEAIPALASHSAIDAMTVQLIKMVAPAVISQATEAIMAQFAPMIHGLDNKLNDMHLDFSSYGTPWSFSRSCCAAGSYNTYVEKDALYRAYCEYCAAIPCCHPEGRTSFLTKFYKTFTNGSSACVSRGGKKLQVVRCITLLPGYRQIIADVRRREERNAAEELASRRRYYFGIGEDTTPDGPIKEA